MSAAPSQNGAMRAMVLEKPGTPLVGRTLKDPEPGRDDVLIAVRACGVCRTDLHIVDGELTEPKLPIIPGHEIVGEVIAVGSALRRVARSQEIW